MIVLALLSISVIAFTASLLATGWIRSIAVERGHMDLPNERSSHAQPVPRGGGVAFVVTSLAAVMCGFALGIVPGTLAFALVVGVTLVASAGWLDDRFGLPASVRFVVQCGAAWLAVHALGGSPFGGVLGLLVALMGIVWVVNLFNFMDGLDGIAATQAVCACVFAAAALGFGANISVAYCCVVVGAAVTGFLWWNRPPAKIFMGDVGSGALGFIIAVLALASRGANAVGITGWAFLIAPFVVDATCTLLLRTFRGERPWKPHRDHVYQRSARRWDSHGSVTAAYAVVASMLGICLVLLGGQIPLFLLVATYVGLVGAYVLLRSMTRGV